MDILILIRNILVPTAIGMWVLIGLVALLIFLRNKLGGKIKPTDGNAYKQTFVQGYNASNDNAASSVQDKADKAVQDALNATKSLGKDNANTDSNNNNNNNNTNKTNLCL